MATLTVVRPHYHTVAVQQYGLYLLKATVEDEARMFWANNMDNVRARHVQNENDHKDITNTNGHSE